MQLMEEDFFGKGELAARLFAERRLDATAVVAFNDEFALGDVQGLSFHGAAGAGGYFYHRDRWKLRQEVYGSAAHLGGPVPGKTGERNARISCWICWRKKVKYVSGSPVQLVKGASVRKIR